MTTPDDATEHCEHAGVHLHINTMPAAAQPCEITLTPPTLAQTFSSPHKQRTASAEEQRLTDVDYLLAHRYKKRLCIVLKFVDRVTMCHMLHDQYT